jgi:hypothetical protein
LLKDPEALPAAMRELLDGRLGRVRDRLFYRHGIDPDAATEEEIEEICLEPGARVAELAPRPTSSARHDAAGGAPTDHFDAVGLRQPRYRFSLHPPP